MSTVETGRVRLADLPAEQQTKEAQALWKFVDALNDIQEIANLWLREEIMGGCGFVADEIMLYIEAQIKAKTEMGIVTQEISEALTKANECDGNCENCEINDEPVGGVC